MASPQPPGPSAPDPPGWKLLSLDILAFRCITTLLGYLQFVNIAKFATPQPRNEELEAHSALATVAVVNHDIVAVSSDVAVKGRFKAGAQTSKLTVKSDMTASSSGDYGDVESAEPPEFAPESLAPQISTESLSVVVTPGQEPDPYYTPPANTYPYIRNGIRRLFTVAKNFLRSDTPEPAPTMEPLIKDLERPIGIRSDKQKDLLDYLKIYPNNLNKYHHLPLEQHLWVVNQLLFVKSESDTPVDRRLRLLRYVVATCYLKLHRRLKHAIWSQPYIDCLSKIPTQQFEFKRHNSAKDSMALKHQRSHDAKFLRYYIYPGGKPRDFRGALNIPHIIRKAESLLQSDSKMAFDLYDNETHLEFAPLVSYLIKTWQFSIQAMKHFRPGPDRQDEKPHKANGYNNFHHALNAAVIAATALMRLRKGSALPMYLQNVQPLLSTPHDDDDLPDLIPIQMLTDDDETLGDPERDQDLEAIHADPSKQPWECYMDWLQVILAHCDAVRILLEYADGITSSPHNSVSIRVLVAPPVDNQLLSWVALLEDDTGRLFPIATAEWLKGEPSRVVDNANIVSALHKARKHFNSQFTIAARQKSIKLDDIAMVRTALKGLKTCGIDTLSLLAADALSTFPEAAEDSKYAPGPAAKGPAVKDLAVKDSAKAKATVQVSPNERLNMGTALKMFLPWAKFFEFLNNFEEGNKIQLSFKGTLHCEVCIASLLHENTLDDKRFGAIGVDLKALGNVIGVSKRCCPVCHHLISKLLLKGVGEDKQKFVIPPPHNDISGCDLPTWLSPGVMKLMIDKFGAQLRHELACFVSHPDLQLIRRISSTASTGFDQSTSGLASEGSEYASNISDSG